MDTSPHWSTADVVSAQDRTSILVAVNGRSSGWQALDWAAAECAVRGSTLRIVHVIARPAVPLDPSLASLSVGLDSQALEQGATTLDEAAARAQLIAPDAPITTHLEFGRVASTISRLGRTGCLVVVGRGRPRGRALRSTSWRIARRTSTPVAIVELEKIRSGGPSAGRVVLGVDDNAGPPWAVAFAFEAAQQRGVGLTVVHACPLGVAHARTERARRRSFDSLRRLVAIDDVVQNYLCAFPQVDVRRRFVGGPADAALVAESEAAALLVIGEQPRGRRHQAAFGAVAQAAIDRAHSPVAIIRAPITAGSEGRI